MLTSHPAKLVLSTLVATLCAVALTASTVGAQSKPPAPPAGAPSPGASGGPVLPRYDKTTEITLKGPIEQVRLVGNPGAVQGTHLMLRQGQQLIEVFAGPTSYLTAQGMTFAKGEAVEVIGSKVQIEGTPALLARQIKKEDKSLLVRDENGWPAWAKKPQ